MKQILAALAAIGCSFAAPLDALALPAYAAIIAQDHCEYLHAGFSWEDATRQALNDNKHWLTEIRADGKRAAKVIQLAIHKECYDLNKTRFNQS